MASPFPPVELLGKNESFGLFPRTAPVGLTGLTGGGILNFDGIDVAGLAVGSRVGLVISGVAYNYTLTTSAAAEASPSVIIPDSGNAAVRWVLDALVTRGLFPDGTVAAPSISFLNDPDTGLFLGASDILYVASGGRTSVRFSTSGAAGYIYAGASNAYIELANLGSLTLAASGTNQSIFLTPSGTGQVQIGSATAADLKLDQTGTRAWTFSANAGRLDLFPGSAGFLSLGSNGALSGLLINKTTDAGNGIIQLNTHTTSAGGIGFGTETSLFRSSAGQLTLNNSGGAARFDLSNSGSIFANILTNGDDFYITNARASGLLYLRTNSLTAITLDTTQGATFANKAVSIHATAGIGYGTGAGGAQTQLTSKATTVVSNTVTTAITTHNAVLNAATIVSFTFTNSSIAATDTVVVTHQSGGTQGAYTFEAFPAAGSAVISIRNATAGNLTEALVLRVTVIKSVSA